MANIQPMNEKVGGINSITITGTPRQMGHALGKRLKSRIDVLVQDCLECLCRTADTGYGMCDTDGTVHIDRCLKTLEHTLQTGMQHMRNQAPHTWMELESIADGAELTPTHIMAVHAINDLLPVIAKAAPVCSSASIMLPSRIRADNIPCIALQWRVPAFLLPHMCLVRRIPAHGPATITLGLNGLHTVAGISEAGNAIVSNEMHCEKSHLDGIPIPCLLDNALSGPTVEDALQRLHMHACMGSRAVFVLNSDGQRASIEISAATSITLADPVSDSPRVHSSHPLHQAFSVANTESYVDSKTQLRRLALTTREAADCDINDISSWFQQSSSQLIDLDKTAPGGSCVCIFEPSKKIIHCHSGPSADNFGSTSL